MALDFTFTCPLANGFHARPASHLAALARDFVSDCILTNLRSGSTADMKSVLSMIAADIRMSDECSVRVQGVDEQTACAALQHFVQLDLAAHDVPLPDLFKDAPQRALPRALESAGAQACFGLPASRGIGQGKAVIVGAIELMPPPLAKAGDPAWEQHQIQRAMAAVRTRMQAKLLEPLSATESGILQAHLAMLDDAALSVRMLEGVARGKSAAQAIVEANVFFGDLL